MAIFFLLIGLEVKREFMEGELSQFSQVVLPGVAAVGGMVVPALIYVWLNKGDSLALNGWAIPAATDIAFALGILSLLGKRVPISLKIFLLALAIIDDLGAIVIIAVFYSADLSIFSLMLGVVCLVLLVAMNIANVKKVAAYIILGVILWVCVLKSGAHATLAGVALALAIPLKTEDEEGHSLLRHLEHTLHPWVSFAILPVFAFANAGVPLHDFSLANILDPVPLGVLLGLVVGKQIGVFGFSFTCIKLGIASMPERATMLQLYGVSTLCGVGFTMSLFIGMLAFEHTGGDYLITHRIGILLGSLISAVLGYGVLRVAPPEG
jgi:NhaA family Na+:H+ antiporter